MGESLPKKIALISRRVIYRDPDEIADGEHMFPFYFLITMPNLVTTIVKAYRRNDYSFAFLGLYVFAGFVLLEFCLFKYGSLPKHEESRQKFWLKWTMWLLYTAISFGFVYQLTQFFPLPMSVALYTAVMVCSAFLFYVLIIHDFVKDWKIRSHGEDETALLQNQTLDAGKLKLNHSDSVCEKV